MIGNIETGAKILLKHLGPSPGWQWESKVLSETPGSRLVIHYHFRAVTEKHRSNVIETVGKFYANVATGEHCYNTMNSIHGLLAKQENSPLAIPEPIFYSRENKFLTLKWVSYRSYRELINSRNYRHYLRMAGKALAQLHLLPVDYGQVKTIEDHLSELITPHPLRLAELIPELAIRIHVIVDKLRQIERCLAPQPSPVSLHRDFHLGQLFWDGRKVWLIDWDTYGLGDPAMDVGNFLVYLATHIPTKSKTAGAAFLEGYRSLMPNVMESSVSFYQALTYLRLACKAYRLKRPDWQERVEYLLSCCEVILSDCGVTL